MSCRVSVLNNNALNLFMYANPDEILMSLLLLLYAVIIFGISQEREVATGDINTIQNKFTNDNDKKCQIVTFYLHLFQLHCKFLNEKKKKRKKKQNCIKLILVVLRNVFFVLKLEQIGCLFLLVYSISLES